MLGASSSSITSHSTGNSSNSDAMSSQKGFPCNSCDLVFENSQTQRTHMREPWHVYNLKRRMASLPPISADDYTENVATSLVSSKPKPSDTTSSFAAVKSSSDEEKDADESDESGNLIDEEAQINRCLFCIRDSGSLEASLEHMTSEHGLYIPDIEHLSSIDTIMKYLRTVITEYNECLYCGMIKQSAEGIRRHMLDKGHCMINLEREPELLEFWEFSDSDAHDTDNEETLELPAQKSDTALHKGLSQGEYTLPSGKVVGSKSKTREARLFARRTALAAKENSSQNITMGATGKTNTVSSAELPRRTQEGNQDRVIAVRNAAGLIGVSDQQIRSLVTVERKMQRQQALVHASAAWAGDKGGIHQRHYKAKMNLRDG